MPSRDRSEESSGVASLDMSGLEDHKLRYELVNELHARPFPAVETPSTAVYLTLKREDGAAKRDRDADMAHLIDLLDRHGASHPQPGANHYFGDIGRHSLKWESHTEFVTYTVFSNHQSERPFDPSDFEVFPQDWLANAPGQRMTSALIRVIPWTSDEDFQQSVSEWFVAESLACARVHDSEIAVAGDFRVDPAGHMRFVVAAKPSASAHRVGRVVQRICEIETYKTVSMLGFARVRSLAPQMGALEDRLSQLTNSLSGGMDGAEKALEELLTISAELEAMVARSSFRISATLAYQGIVNQRIDVLREERFQGQQTFGEFMMRRYEPAMRTVLSAKDRFEAMSARANRTANLLRTRVDVERSAQNQALLTSMDRRADLQLRLQKTVEGFSVVAISYYAVSLAGYMLYPLAESWGMSQSLLVALVAPLILVSVWLIIRRIRNGMG